MSTHNHMRELTNEVVSTLKHMTAEKQKRVLTLFKSKLSDVTVQPEAPAFLTSPCHAWILPDEDFQGVPRLWAPTQDQQRVAQSEEQRVGTTPEMTPVLDLRRMSNAPPIMIAPNPTTKRALKFTKQVHRHITRNNIPGTVPPTTPAIPRHPIPPATNAPSEKRSPRLGKTAQRIQDTRLPKRIPKVHFVRIPKVRFVRIAGRLRNHNVISQQAMNFLTDKVWNNLPQHFTPTNLRPKEDATAANLEHFAMPMIHPTTGETISSYKKLMNDPDTMEIWQTAFGKDFGGMAQGHNKTGKEGTNTIFVMTHAEILLIPADRTITYARAVVDFCPQKADPHRIRITAGGNLINYPGELTTRTANLTTSKLMRNSVLSTEGAKYMCLDITLPSFIPCLSTSTTGMSTIKARARGRFCWRGWMQR